MRRIAGIALVLLTAGTIYADDLSDKYQEIEGKVKTFKCDGTKLVEYAQMGWRDQELNNIQRGIEMGARADQQRRDDLTRHLNDLDAQAAARRELTRPAQPIIEDTSAELEAFKKLVVERHEWIMSHEPGTVCEDRMYGPTWGTYEVGKRETINTRIRQWLSDNEVTATQWIREARAARAEAEKQRKEAEEKARREAEEERARSQGNN